MENNVRELKSRLIPLTCDLTPLADSIAFQKRVPVNSSHYFSAAELALRTNEPLRMEVNVKDTVRTTTKMIYAIGVGSILYNLKLEDALFYTQERPQVGNGRVHAYPLLHILSVETLGQVNLEDK